MAVVTRLRFSVAAALLTALYFGQNSFLNLKNIHRRAAGPVAYCNRMGVIALTFDDGVHKDYTPDILNALKDTGAKATFHVSGQYLDDFLVGKLLWRIQAEGHTLGFKLQGPDPITLTETQLRDNLNAQAAAIEKVAGVSPKFIRVKPGASNATTDDWISRAGFIQSRWSLDTADYRSCSNSVSLNATIIQTYRDTLSRFAAAGGGIKGSIIALHSDLCTLGDTIRSLVPMVMNNYGYEFIPIESCLDAGGKYNGGPLPPPVTTTTKVTTGTGAGGTTWTSTITSVITQTSHSNVPGSTSSPAKVNSAERPVATFLAVFTALVLACLSFM